MDSILLIIYVVVLIICILVAVNIELYNKIKGKKIFKIGEGDAIFATILSLVWPVFLILVLLYKPTLWISKGLYFLITIPARILTRRAEKKNRK